MFLTLYKYTEAEEVPPGEEIPDADGIYGGAGDDVLQGSDGDDALYGLAGHDWLEGHTGADLLDGGDGTDTVTYESSDEAVTVNLRDGMGEGGHAEGDIIIGVENVIGSDYGDVLWGDYNSNRLYGGGGNDELWGAGWWGSVDVLEGGAGADQLYGYGDYDSHTVVSYEGSDEAVTVNLRDGTGKGGHADGDVIIGVNNIIGSDYGDVLEGNDNSNQLEGGTGADRLDGGGGYDTVSYSSSDEGVDVRLQNGTGEGGHAEGDVIIDVENVIGSDYGDSLEGNYDRNRLEGGAGADWLYGSLGDDELDGGAGADRLHGSDGDDYLLGSDGDDLLEGGAGADELYGGAGIDTISYETSDSAVFVNLLNLNLEGGHAEGDFLNLRDYYDEVDINIPDVENVIGSNNNDQLIGNALVNVLHGGGGNDRLYGDYGDDTLNGGLGNDRLYGDYGDDNLTANNGKDRLYGGYGDDTLLGGNGNDRLYGDHDDDLLEGGTGVDRLFGGTGDDILNGGAGNDRLYGGYDDDTFIFDTGHGNDTIKDFTDGEDLIDLTAFDLPGFGALTISPVSGGVRIDLSTHGGGTILLEGFDIANLDTTDFLFS